MRTLTLLLILSMVACVPRNEPEISVEDRILSKYLALAQKENASDQEIFSQMPEPVRFELSGWKNSSLMTANIISSMEMQKHTKREIDGILDRLAMGRGVGGLAASDSRQSLRTDLETESARLALINWYIPTAPLPIDVQQKFDGWKREVLLRASIGVLSRMRTTSAHRIASIELRINELKRHPQEIIWDDHVHYSLQLKFEVTRLRAIDARIKNFS